MSGGRRLGRCAGLTLVCVLLACSETPSPHATYELPAADCSNKPDESTTESEACAILCAVPGGVTECPAGTPCPMGSSQAPRIEADLDRSLCRDAKDTANCADSHPTQDVQRAATREHDSP